MGLFYEEMAIYSKMHDSDKRRTRNSSEDKIANVNFLYDNIVHVLQNAINSCINSTKARLCVGTHDIYQVQ